MTGSVLPFGKRINGTALVRSFAHAGSCDPARVFLGAKLLAEFPTNGTSEQDAADANERAAFYAQAFGTEWEAQRAVAEAAAEVADRLLPSFMTAPFVEVQ